MYAFVFSSNRQRIIKHANAMMKFVMTLKSMMLAVACCLVMPFSLQAQDVIISGRLVDDQQQPVEYANVVLLSLPDSAFVAGAVSDEQGAFRLN